MKKNDKTKDLGAPYRNFSISMVKAPVKSESEPKSSIIKSTDDLRCNGGK